MVQACYMAPYPPLYTMVYSMLYNTLHTSRIVLCSWLRSHTVLPLPCPSTSELTWICQVTASCGTPGLFFRCTVCPTGSLQTPSKHKELALVFFSTFEPITLTPGAVTQRNGVPMLYDTVTASSSNLPSLYLCLARNVLGRVPLTPCFVRGNRTPTLPHSFKNRQGVMQQEWSWQRQQAL